MKYVIKIVKRLVISLLFLFSLNMVIRYLNIVVPINLINILLTAILGVPGIICLLIIKLFFL